VNILEFLFNLIPASFAVTVPAETFTVSLGTTGSIKVSTPSFSLTVAKA
jgi:hypothetical protein